MTKTQTITIPHTTFAQITLGMPERVMILSNLTQLIVGRYSFHAGKLAPLPADSVHAFHYNATPA